MPGDREPTTDHDVLVAGETLVDCFPERGGSLRDAVDPTGAGDAFTAGLLAALARGERTPTECWRSAMQSGRWRPSGRAG